MTTGPSKWCVQATILRVMDMTRPRRRTISTVLALLLAVESVAAVSAAAGGVLAGRSASHALPDASPEGQVLADIGTADRAWEPGPNEASTPPVSAAIAADDAPDYLHPRPATPAARTAPEPTATPKPAATPRPTAKPAVKVTVKSATATKPKAVTYTGRNHAWIPSLGVNQSVASFPCDRAAPPDNYVYRWGCAGGNNVYLLGHAYGVFRPLHDAYLDGRLRVGMKVYYADNSGQVQVYVVRWWKLTAPTTDASWAWAAQATPSMTLQTCMGANSRYRLIVRLVQVG